MRRVPRVHAVPGGGLRQAPPRPVLWGRRALASPGLRPPACPRPGPSSAVGAHGGIRRLRAVWSRRASAPAELQRESLPPSAPLPCWSPDSRGGKCAKLQLSGVVAPAAEAVSPARRVGAELGKQLENAQKYFHSGQARRSLTPLLPSPAPAPLAPWPGTPRSPARGRGGVSVCECVRVCESVCVCACVCVCRTCRAMPAAGLPAGAAPRLALPAAAAAGRRRCLRWACLWGRRGPGSLRSSAYGRRQRQRQQQR